MRDHDTKYKINHSILFVTILLNSNPPFICKYALVHLLAFKPSFIFNHHRITFTLEIYVLNIHIVPDKNAYCETICFHMDIIF